LNVADNGIETQFLWSLLSLFFWQILNPGDAFGYVRHLFAVAPSFLACLCDSRRKTRQQAKARRGPRN